MKTINKATSFVILTFVISFLSAGVYKLLGGSSSGGISFTVLSVIYMFMPTVAVIIVKKFMYHESIGSDLLVSLKINRWFFAAVIFMPIVSLLTLGISLLFPGVIYSEILGMLKRFESMVTPEQAAQLQTSLESLPVNPILLTLITGVMGGITVNAVAAFGEEFGWRGFLLNAFKEMSFLRASVLIGFIWGIWHAPLILMGHNYPDHPQIGVLMMIVWCILLTPLFLYITIKAKSVIAAAIMHGTLNGTAGLTLMFTDGGNDLTVGISGLTGFIALLVCFVVLFIYDHFISKERILTNRISRYLSP
jgi:membrane protease YdiL (CAAX protease family)